ncbi:SH3 domain-containing protein [Candidatus Entotheonella palauensis]|uniref:SH3 domain-containing protein n=1 Tax=Candidatus Entotheonella palauensis TaxID=93172 RepID=UPI000B7F7D7A|nr:YMGG-like glycine zipper-containing protein [Candidatus Entotheonella palauensis]
MLRRFTTWKQSRTIAIIIILAFVLSSCATMDGGLRANYSNPNDPCNVHRETLIGSQDHFKKSMITGGALGAGAGAAAGAAIDKDNPLRGALIGALIGAAAGAAGGYLAAKQKAAKNREELRQAINQDINNDSVQVGKLGRTLRALNLCRAGQVADIQRGLNTGSLSRDVARTQIATVRSAVAADNELVQQILQDVNKRNAVYVASIADVENMSQEQLAKKVDRYEPRVVHRPKGSRVATPATGETLLVKTRANFRDAPGMHGKVIKQLEAGQPVKVHRVEKGSWYHVQAGDTDGYIFHTLVSKRKSKTSQARGGLPVVDRKARPKATTEVEALVHETKDVNEEHDAQLASLEQELKDLEALTIKTG